MDETPEVTGDLILDQTCISNKNMIHDLEQKGFGEIAVSYTHLTLPTTPYV